MDFWKEYILLTIILQFMIQCNPDQISRMIFNVKIKKFTLKFVWKCSEPRKTKTSLKNNKVRECHYLISRLL